MYDYDRRVGAFNLPKDVQEVDEGRFHLYYAPRDADVLGAVKDHLRNAEAEYKQVGLPLRGTTRIVLIGTGPGGSKAYGAYVDQYNAFRIKPKSVVEGFPTFIHEIAHWQHSRHITGGYGNQDILSKYNEAMTVDRGSGGSTSDRLYLEISKKVKELEGLTDAMDIPRATKGEVFSWNGLRYIVLKVTRSQATFAPVDKSQPPATYSGYAFNEILDQAGLMPDFQKVKRMIESLQAEIRSLRESYHKAQTQSSRFEAVQTRWVPTEYSRKNHKEWFAEIVTTMIFKPGGLDQEVKEWVRGVWG